MSFEPRGVSYITRRFRYIINQNIHKYVIEYDFNYERIFIKKIIKL